MEAEIIYRGLSFIDEKWIWVYGFYYEVSSEGKDYGYIIWQGNHTFVEIKSVEQYINKRDKNGVRIFTGDILKCKSPNCGSEFITTFSVSLCNGIRFDNNELLADMVMYDYDMPDDIEIIGNIHKKKLTHASQKK